VTIATGRLGRTKATDEERNVDRTDLEDWLARYRRAWTNDDPAEIAGLFTEDASYSPWPFSKAWQGRERIVEKWIDRGDSNRPWGFEHEILAFEGDTGVVRGLTTSPPYGDEPLAVYSNIWLVRLEPDGRAREFAEWWIEKPSDKPRG
jgi:ketosteroid isomerase-like protein